MPVILSVARGAVHSFPGFSRVNRACAPIDAPRSTVIRASASGREWPEEVQMGSKKKNLAGAVLVVSL
jgi:hypothetical protein